jgi:hypothetical protein
MGKALTHLIKKEIIELEQLVPFGGELLGEMTVRILRMLLEYVDLLAEEKNESS